MSSPGRRRLTPPSGGTRPPDSVEVGDGEALFLAPLAHEAATRYRREFPDEEQRYGPAGFLWCVHDNHWLIAWAAMDQRFSGVFARELEWLADLLAARGYPLERLGARPRDRGRRRA